jgi:hypothetical protein
MSRRTKLVRAVRSKVHRMIDSGLTSDEILVCGDQFVVLPRVEAEQRQLVGISARQFLEQHDGTDQARFQDA